MATSHGPRSAYINSSFASAAAAVQMTLATAKREHGPDGVRIIPKAPAPADKPVARHLVVLLDTASLDMLRGADELDINLDHPVLGPSTPHARIFFGSIFYIHPDNSDDVLRIIKVGSPIKITSLAPASEIHPINNTIIFPSVEITSDTNYFTGTAHSYVDPRLPCAFHGTPEFAARAHAAMLSSCGEATPDPCMSCRCPQKPAP